MSSARGLTCLESRRLLQDIRFLPFLYQTRTILGTRHLTKRDQIQQKRSISRSVKQGQWQTRKTLEDEVQRQPRLVTLDQESQADILPSFNYNSTLTPLEDQKFRRIFEAAARGLPPPSLQQKQAPESSPYTFGESLDDVFEKCSSIDEREPARQDADTSARDDEETIKSQPRRVVPAHIPESLRWAWKDVQKSIGINDARQRASQEETAEIKRMFPQTEQQKELEMLQAADVASFKASLEKAKDDKAVWTLLEDNIFSKMQALTETIRTKSEKAKKNRKGQGTDLETKAKSSEGKGKQLSKKDMAVVQGTYQQHLVNALRIIRTKTPRSPYSSVLLSTVKRLGPISHLLGASTALYNEMLYIAWRQRTDVAECAQLMEDMYAQGLQADFHTKAVFLDARKEMQAALRGEEDSISPARRVWWNLQGVQSAMTRWRAVMDLHKARAKEEEDWEKQKSEDSMTWRRVASTHRKRKPVSDNS